MQPARQPAARAEERVGGAADHQAARFRLLHHLAAEVGLDGERLLREDVLAGGERRERDGGMRVGNGEVHDEVDVAAREQRIDGERLDVELLALRRGAIRLAGRPPRAP